MKTETDFNAAIEHFIEINKPVFDGVDTQSYMDEVRERDDQGDPERRRLERAVIEAAKAYGRANRALEDHMKTSNGAQDQESVDGWQLLRDLESSWENLMLDSLDALLTFESEQEKKS